MTVSRVAEKAGPVISRFPVPTQHTEINNNPTLFHFVIIYIAIKMGTNLSKKVIPQDTEAMQHYCQSVMTRSEIEQWRQFWTSLYPSGVATRDHFDSFAKIASLTYSTTGVDLMFRLLDTNRDGKITFLEFLW